MTYIQARAEQAVAQWQDGNVQQAWATISRLIEVYGGVPVDAAVRAVTTDAAFLAAYEAA